MSRTWSQYWYKKRPILFSINAILLAAHSFSRYRSAVSPSLCFSSECPAVRPPTFTFPHCGWNKVERRRGLRRSFRSYLSEGQLNERVGGAFLLNGLDLSSRQSSLPRPWQWEMARDSFARLMRPRNAITRRAILDDLRSHFWPVCIELPLRRMRSRFAHRAKSKLFFFSIPNDWPYFFD